MLKSQTATKHRGWSFEEGTGTISGNSGLLSLGRRLSNPYSAGDTLPFCVHGATRSLKPCTCGSALVMGVRMHLPEAVFGSNHLTISHESGLTITFTAEDALMHWARDSVEKGSRSLRVPAAGLPAWTERMDAAQMRSSTDVDWTFSCSDFAGTCGRRGSAAPPASRPLLGSLVLPVPVASDQAAPDALPQDVWEAHHGSGLDKDGPAGRLLRTPEPILWSAEVPLFEV